jgi:hypothetical protein
VRAGPPPWRTIPHHGGLVHGIPPQTRPRSEALCDIAAGEELRNTYISAHWRRCFADFWHDPCGGADGVGPSINEAVEERLVSLLFFLL